MLLKVINPNTTQSMTDTIAACARAVAGPGTRIQAVSPAMGPVSIESHYDEALSVPGILIEVASGEAEGADGYLIACFGDPGLEAAREVANGPVIGIAEAAMHAASFLGRRFTVVTTLGRTTGRAWDLADRYGMRQFCAGVHACELPVLELESDPGAREIVTAACRAALDEDDADVVVLGCAGMTKLCQQISVDIGAPVVDGVAAGVAFLQGLVGAGLATATRGEFSAPPPKPYTGLLRGFGG